jgi:hypothetical protein
MRAKAVLMALAMMTTALAGCTGTDGVTEVDEDALNELIQNNLQDFINNTTVVVNQDFHYHNNTTVVQNDYTYDNDTTNEYTNNTNIEGSDVVNNYEDNDYSNTSYGFGNGGASFGTGVNGTVTGSSMMFVAHLEFTAQDLFPEWYVPGSRSNTFAYYWEFYDYLTNSYTNGTFTYSCGEYYLIGSLSNGSTYQVSYWEDSDNYWDAWDNEYNSTTADLLTNAASETGVREVCDEDYAPDGHIWGSGYNSEDLNILSIDIPFGYAIQYLQLNSEHRWSGNQHDCDPGEMTYECESFETPGWNGSNASDNVWHTYPIMYSYSEGADPGNHYQYYYGGWDNLTVDINFKTYWEHHYFSSWESGNFGSADYTRTEYAIWPSSQFVFTLYYQFVPIVPVE